MTCRNYELVTLCGTTSHQISTGTLQIKREDGTLLTDACTGNGLIDAVFQAIDRITGVCGTLVSLEIKSIGRGRDASGKAAVEVEFGGNVFKGEADHTNIIEASARAYLNALNRFLANTPA